MTALHEQMQDNDLAAVAAFGDIVKTIMDELKVYVKHGLVTSIETSIASRLTILQNIVDGVNDGEVIEILNKDILVLGDMQECLEDQLDFYHDELHNYAELWNDVNEGKYEYTKETCIDEDFRDE